MINVLVVDDSLFMRTLVSDMLNSDPEIKVIDTAKSGLEGLRKLCDLNPDVVTLDLRMSGQDGLSTLKKIMSEHPVPVVILSAHSQEGADITLQCLDAGAVSFVLKPSGELSLDIESVKDQLLAEVHSAAKAQVKNIQSLVTKKLFKRRLTGSEVRKIVVIGSSTGGPQTLEVILPLLPSDIPFPVLVVQHMPDVLFTRGLVERLDEHTAMVVKVASHRERLRAGTVYFAPSGCKLTIKKASFVKLAKEKKSQMSPSIDITMKSVARQYESGSVGVILTGMGSDGVEGMTAIKNAGGQTIVQDESSIIFGMPKAVMDQGLADSVLPAADIPGAILDAVGAING